MGPLKKTKKSRKNGVKYSLINVFTGSDLSSRRLATMEIKSENPGPVVWLTGCIHGDEVGGMVIIQEAFKKLSREGLLKGSVYAFPLMNPIGFETGSHGIIISSEISPAKEDINRSFPGDKSGSIAERLAYIIFNKIKSTNPTIVLDFHNDWVNSVPHVLIDPYPGKEHKDAHEKLLELAKETGMIMIGESREEVQKTLTWSLLQANIPSLTLEIGGAYVVNEANVKEGTDAIYNILSHLGMITSLRELTAYPMPLSLKDKKLEYSYEPRCETTGVIRFLAQPGEVVEKGQPLARIYNVFGKLVETLEAVNDCIIIGHSDSSVAHPGLEVIASGIIRKNIA